MHGPVRLHLCMHAHTIVYTESLTLHMKGYTQLDKGHALTLLPVFTGIAISIFNKLHVVQILPFTSIQELPPIWQMKMYPMALI